MHVSLILSHEDHFQSQDPLCTLSMNSAGVALSVLHLVRRE